jgi:hypothetical protein
MKISLEQAASILARTQDEVLYLSSVENKLVSFMVMDDDIIYNEDGTVSFQEGIRDPVWEFEIDEVLKLKKEMDEGLVGEVEGILEGK